MKAAAESLVVSRPRWLDFVELTKPRIALLVLFTVGIGAALAQPGPADLAQIFHVVVGTALVAAGASALNQLLEQKTDAQMRRTENRPLPAGRLSPGEVLGFGLALSVGGLAYQAVTLREPLAVLLTALTLVSYVFIYTPLKRVTTFNTLIGAVPGALPPVIGWAAMTGRIDLEAAALFLIVFLWQVPHFLAIAWLYRADYSRAGLKMLPNDDASGLRTARQMLLYSLVLVPVSALPFHARGAGMVFTLAAAALGGYMAFAAWNFRLEPSRDEAKQVLQASLLYLPLIFAMLLVERLVAI